MEKSGVGIGSQSQVPMVSGNIIEIRNIVPESENPENVSDFDERSGILENSETEEIDNSNVIFAEDLFQKAKEDGDDAALEMLANEEGLEDLEIEEEEQVIEEKEPEVDQGKQVEKDNFINAQVEMMTAKVDLLMEENKVLGDRVAKLEDINREVLKSTYELAMLLKKTLEGGKDQEKNKGFLEALANLIAKIISLIVVDGDKARKEVEDKPIIEKKAA